MSELDWTALEDAVLAALGDQLGAQAHTLESYQGDWRADLQLEAWRLPAVLVSLAGTRAAAAALRSYDLTVDLRLLVIVQQLRGQTEGRRQVGGAYQLLGAIRETLWHQDLGLDILPLALVREEPLLNNRQYSVYAAWYRTGAVVDRF
jgi:phage gp37-like protein